MGRREPALIELRRRRVIFVIESLSATLLLLSPGAGRMWQNMIELSNRGKIYRKKSKANRTVT